MEKTEDWKSRFLSTSCELKDLLGGISGNSFPTDTVYSVLNNCKQLMKVAVETFCMGRFKIHSVALVHVDEASDTISRITLDDVLSSLCSALQASNSSSFDTIVDRMLSESVRQEPKEDVNLSAKQEKRISIGNPSPGEITNDRNTGDDCNRLQSGYGSTSDDQDDNSDGRILCCKEQYVLEDVTDNEVVIKLNEDDAVETERACNNMNEPLTDIPLDDSDNYSHSISSRSTVIRDVSTGGNDGGKITHPSVSKRLLCFVEPGKCKRRMANVAKDSDVKKQYRRKLSLNKRNRKGSRSPAKVSRTPTIEEGKRVTHTINFLSFKCFLCVKADCVYASFKELTSHISSVHAIADGSGRRVLHCSMQSDENCSWSKSFRGLMDRDQVAYSLTHLIFNHNRAIPDYVQPFHCPFPNCTYEAVRKFSIDSHLSTHDTELVPCQRCGKMLKKKSMHLHRMFCEVIGLKVKPNRCPVDNCDRSFKSKYSLLNHIKANHQNIRAYRCPSCDKGFVNKSDYSCHMFACHGVTVSGCKQYDCEICNFSTVAKPVFHRHVMRLHPKLWPLIESCKKRGRNDKTLEVPEVAAVDVVRKHFREEVNESTEEILEVQQVTPASKEPLTNRTDVQINENVSTFDEMQESKTSSSEQSIEQGTIKQCEESTSDILHSSEHSNLRLTDKSNRNVTVKEDDEDTIESEKAHFSPLTKGHLQKFIVEDFENVSSVSSQICSATRNVLQTGSSGNPTATDISRNSVEQRRGKRNISSVEDNNDKHSPPYKRKQVSCVADVDNESPVLRKSLNRTQIIIGGKKVSHSINFVSYKCFLCDTANCVYDSFKELATHISSAHAVADGSRKRALHCFKKSEGNCSWSKIFRDLINRDQVSYCLTHLVLNHNMAIPEFVQPFHCPFPNCTYEAVRKFSIDSHLSTHDTELVPCPHCGKMLKKKSMHLHRMFCEVIGLKVKPNHCPVEKCTKCFKSKYSLLKHIKANHENIKAYQCTSCKKGFVNESDYACHMFDSHGVNVSGYEQYDCPICNFSTVVQTAFNKHVMKTHPKLWQMTGNSWQEKQKSGKKNTENTHAELENTATGLLKTLVTNLKRNSQEETSVTQPNKPKNSETMIDLPGIRLEEGNEVKKQVPKFSDCEDHFAVSRREEKKSCSKSRCKNRRNGSVESTESPQMTDVDTRQIQINIGETDTDLMRNYANSSETEEDEDGRSRRLTNCSQSSAHAMNLTRFQCFLCQSSDVVFKSITSLYGHIRDSHSSVDNNGKRVLKCPECNTKKMLKRHGNDGIDRDLLARLLNHLIVKHKWNVPESVVPYYCSHSGCAFFSIQLRNLKAHLRRHTDQEKVPCDKCGKFLNPLSLREHSLSCAVSVDERKVLHCSQCDKTFTKKQGLESHIRIKHENIKDFLCSHCTMRFGSGLELEEHAFNMHRINPRNKPMLTCPQCPFVTIRVARFEKHVKIVHANVREHSCPVCNKGFKTAGQLRNHMQGHNEKAFKCHLCDFCTARKQNLHEHIQAQHIRKQFKCEFCDYVTGYMANLHKHMRVTCRRKQNESQKTE